MQAAALDLYLELEAEAKELSDRKCAARDAVLALCEHGDIIAASDGRSRMAVNETVKTNQHKKVVDALAADYEVPADDLKALYASTAGSKSDKDLKKV
jgi:hypothetical protein